MSKTPQTKKVDVKKRKDEDSDEDESSDEDDKKKPVAKSQPAKAAPAKQPAKPAAKAPAKKQESSDEDDDDDDDSDDDKKKPAAKAPAKAPVKAAPVKSAPAKPAAKKQESSDEDESSEDDKPAAKKPAPAKAPAKPAAKAPAKKQESSDEDEDESSEEDTKKKPASKPAAKPAAKAPAKPAAKKQESSDEDEDEDESSEEDTKKKPAAKKPAPAPAKAAPAKQAASKWFSKSDSEDSEDDKKKKKPAAKKPAAKKQESSDEDESSEEDTKKPAAKKPAAAQSKWFKAQESSEEEEDSEEDEKPKKKAAPKKPAKPASKWFTNKDDSEEEEAPKETKKPAEAPAKKDEAKKGANKWLKNDDDDEEEEAPAEKKPAPTGAAKWLKSEDDGNEDAAATIDKKDYADDGDMEDFDVEDDKRVVRSHREQRLEEIKDVSGFMLGAAKDNQWQQASDEYNNLLKTLEKAMKQLNLKEPLKTFIKAVVDLEDLTKTTIKSKKNLATLEGKALQTLAGKVRKHNAQYQKLVDACRKDPKSFENDDLPAAAAAEQAKPARVQTVAEEQTSEGAPEKKLTKKQMKRKGDNKTRAPKQPKAIVKQEVVWTGQMIEDVLRKIKQNRGKKGAAPQEQYNQLKTIAEVSNDAFKLIEIFMEMIAVQFTLVPSSLDYMSSEGWKSCYQTFSYFLDLVEANPSIVLAEPDSQIEDRNAIQLSGTLFSVVERLEEEYVKSLQFIDHSTHEYVSRLRDEVMIVDIAERVFSYYKKKKEFSKAAIIAVKIFEHLHFRKQADHEKLLDRQRKVIPSLREEAAQAVAKHQDHVDSTVCEVISKDLSATLASLSDLIYAHSTQESNVKTLLMHVFHHALHGRYNEARDILVMSKVQDLLPTLEPPIVVMYHRAIAQIGLCAFSTGMIAEAHAALAELCSTQRVKELLAQGISNIRYQTMQEKARKLEIEKIERARLIPYHMHINLDKLEVAHLICALLLDVPNSAQCSYANLKKKTISKALKKLLDFYDRQVFLGPPESTKEHINLAARALAKGDWRRCYNYISKLPIYNMLVENEKGDELLKNRIKVESLRTYLFTFARHYDVIGLKELSAMFDLKPNTVHSILSKMMINEEFLASWDQPSQCIVVSHAEPTSLQFGALHLADRVNSLLEHNERLYDTKTGGTGYGAKHDVNAKHVGSKDNRGNNRMSQRNNKNSMRRSQQQKRQTRA